MASYKTVVNLGDFGPWVSKLVLELPGEARGNDVDAASFNVYCERHTLAGEVLLRKEHGADHAAPSAGYVDVLAAYPCDEEGARLERGCHVALELPEVRLTKTIEGGVMGSQCLDMHYRVTQLRAIPGEPDPVSGLVFDECAGELCPALRGWHNAVQATAVDGFALEYGYYEPSFEPVHLPFGGTVEKPERAALIVWLHGAGEGGRADRGAYRAYAGNRVTGLSGARIQSYFGGAAWVLVPQSPTFWMDDGVEQLGRSNISIYTRALKALIDEFVAAHADRVDPDRIVVGGLSNGGFMTVRMVADYPGFFCAGIPTCAPFFVENQTPETLAAIAKTPLWFVHSKGDELVNPNETSLPLVHALRAAGAEAHMTYFDHVEDLTGMYKEPDGRPKQTFNHGVWIHVYNDFCRSDLDGTNVMVDGEPVGCWEWAAKQRLA